MAYIDHPAIPIQPEGRLVSQGVKQGGLRSICKPESKRGGGLRLSRGRFFLISSVVVLSLSSPFVEQVYIEDGYHWN